MTARTRLGLVSLANPAERHALIKSIGQQPAQAQPVSAREAAALGLRYAPRWLRQQVLERDGYACVNCAIAVTDATANIDHKTPWPYGMTELVNLQTLCRPCNQAKGRKTGKNAAAALRSARRDAHKVVRPAVLVDPDPPRVAGRVQA